MARHDDARWRRVTDTRSVAAIADGEAAYMPLTRPMQRVLQSEATRRRWLDRVIVGVSSLAGASAAWIPDRQASAILLLCCGLTGLVVSAGLIWFAASWRWNGAPPVGTYAEVRGAVRVIRASDALGEHLVPAYYLAVGDWRVSVPRIVQRQLAVTPVEAVVTVARGTGDAVIFEIRDAHGTVLYRHPRYQKAAAA